MPDARPIQVLYIEDDRLNIVLMEEVFRTLPGWQLRCAEDGAQALEMLGKGPRPDLVLVDMNLPDMNGLTLLRRLGDDASMGPLRCVALSADDQADQVQAAREAGFCDYWVKPIDVRRIAQALRNALQQA
ncbi:MAG: response regulator [Burkholderiaceae bacterium]